MRKKNPSDQVKLKAKNLQNFEIIRTIYSNSERSEEFLVTECFFNLFLIRTIQIQIGKKILGFRTSRKS